MPLDGRQLFWRIWLRVLMFKSRTIQDICVDFICDKLNNMVVSVALCGNFLNQGFFFEKIVNEFCSLSPIIIFTVFERKAWGKLIKLGIFIYFFALAHVNIEFAVCEKFPKQNFIWGAHPKMK